MIYIDGANEIREEAFFEAYEKFARLLKVINQKETQSSLKDVPQDIE